MQFDYYFSIWINCEGAFQIRRVLGRDSSCFFSWNVTKFDALISLLSSSFEDTLQLKNLTPRPGTGLIFDSSHNYLLHSPFKDSDPWEGEYFENTFASLQSKFRYLIDKFYRIAQSGNSVVYFYRTEEDGVQEKSKAVVQLLSKIHKADNFRFVVLQKEAFKEPDWGIPLIHNRYLKRFAPWNDATDGHVASWDRVFASFPLARDALRLSGFDKISDSMNEGE